MYFLPSILLSVWKFILFLTDMIFIDKNMLIVVK